MTDTVFEIHLPGPNASAVAAEFRTILTEELPTWSTRVETPEPQPDKHVDPALAVAVVALVVAVPGALKDGLDLADRFKLGERLKALLERLKVAAARIEIDPGPFLFLPGGVAPLPLDTTTPDQILQAILSTEEGQEQK